MSNASMVKLAELGDAAAWMDWLREQKAAALEASASLLEEERARTSSAGQPKWRVKARLLSPGVSIRPKALARWNKGVDHIKLAAGSKGRVLGIEATLLDDVHIGSLASVLTGVLTRLMLAFNIGTLSLFVWEESRFQGAFCDSIYDIENDAELHAVPLSPGPVDWGRHALSETDMQDVMLAMAVMPFPGDKEFEPFERYRRAVVMLGKADVHMNLVPAAVEELRASMASTMVTLGGWDGSGALRDALEAQVGDVLGSFEEDDRALVTDQASSSIVEIEKALRVKVILDALLIRFLRARAVERKAAESARASSRRTSELQGAALDRPERTLHASQ